jgi:AcrR family transcriptional regulator
MTLSSTKSKPPVIHRKKRDPSVGPTKGPSKGPPKARKAPRDDGKVPSLRPGKPGGPRDENRKQRSEALKKAALALFLARGIEGCSIDDIAQAAGVAKGSFYRYYEDKTALVAALVQPVAQEIESALARTELRLSEATDRSSAYAAYQELALALMPVAIFQFDVARLYLQEARAPQEGARAPIAALVDIIDRGAVRLSEVAVQHGIVSVKDPRITAFATVGAIEQLTISVLRGRLDATPVEIVSTLIRMVYDGIGTRREGTTDPKPNA